MPHSFIHQNTYELTKAERTYIIYIQFNMPLISIARLRFLKAAKMQKFMLILGSFIGRSFIAFFHFIP